MNNYHFKPFASLLLFMVSIQFEVFLQNAHTDDNAVHNLNTDGPKDKLCQHFSHGNSFKSIFCVVVDVFEIKYRHLCITLEFI